MKDRIAAALKAVSQGFSADRVVADPDLNAAEQSSLSGTTEHMTDESRRRQDWLDTVRRAVPSCFCDPDLLA
jgi:hypothetical protein